MDKARVLLLDDKKELVDVMKEHLELGGYGKVAACMLYVVGQAGYLYCYHSIYSGILEKIKYISI